MIRSKLENRQAKLKSDYRRRSQGQSQEKPTRNPYIENAIIAEPVGPDRKCDSLLLHPQHPSMEKSKTNSIFHREYLLIAALTLIAVLLRLNDLDRPLTGDEGRTFNRYGLLSWKILLFVYDDTNQHSLFSLLSNFCMRLFAENEIVFRLPSFLAGVLAIPLIYYLSRSLNNSRGTSFCSSALLIFSGPHLTYSQMGRGYSLTVFLALALILAATRLLQKNSPAYWGGLLVLSGFCMVLTLPSNVFFLTTAGVYCLIATWINRHENGKWLNKSFFSIAISFLILLIFVGIYLEGIYASLIGFTDSWKGHIGSKPGISLFFQISEFLVSPWNPWLYVLILFGCFGLKSKTSRALFFSIVATPALIMSIFNIGGFPRTYMHTLPFFLILAAMGIMEIIKQGQKLNPLLEKSLPILIAIVLLYISIKNLTLYYDKFQSYPPNTSMAEAQQVASYLQEKIPLSKLIVLGRPDSDVLNHYLQNQIQDSATLFILGKKPERLIFINRHDMPPWSHSVSGKYGNLIVPENSVKQIVAIGDTRVYEFDRNIEPFFPSLPDPDYETKIIHTFDSPDIKIRKEKDQVVLGKHSLQIKNNTGKIFKLDATTIKHVDITKEETFILTIYLRKLTQQSGIFVLDSGTNNSHPAQFAQLIPANKNYQTPANSKDLMVDKTNKLWEKAFFLYPITKGSHDLVEVFNLIHQENY